MPTAVPTANAFIDTLSAVNPWLLWGEVASALLLGIGIFFESDRWCESVKKTAFHFVWLGVLFETLFTIALFKSETWIADSQRDTIISQGAQIRLAQTHLTDRTMGEDDRDFFIMAGVLGRKGQKIHIFTIEDDAEAALFGRSLKDTLESPIPGWVVTISPLPHPARLGPASAVGPLPVGMWGPFTKEPDKDSEANSAAVELYGFLIGLNFCITHTSYVPFADPDPSTITLLIWSKDRSSKKGCR